eukprot:SAG11_NODE_5499_length_1543_cov_8.338643_2_plen_95_part_00
MIFDDKKNKLDVGDAEALGGSVASSIDLQVASSSSDDSASDDHDDDEDEDEKNKDDDDDKEEDKEEDKKEGDAEAEILGAEGEQDEEDEGQVVT